MNLVDAFVISTRSRDADELSKKDIYVKRFLADQVTKHKLTPDRLPLEYWNQAIELFGGEGQTSASDAYETLMDLLDYKRGGGGNGEKT